MLSDVATMMASNARGVRHLHRALNTSTAAAAKPADVVIVGSGVSGLLALNSCLKAGLQTKCFEARAVAGGIWSGHGVYESLQLQQHKDDFLLPGQPWPEGTPDFPRRDDVLSYVSRYIVDHGLDEHIQTRTPVKEMRYDEQEGLWLVSTATGEPVRSRYVAFAGGSLGGATTPPPVTKALERFDGPVVHSHDYYRSVPFAGHDVVLLGFGASSVEIAADLARSGRCKSVTMVAPPRLYGEHREEGEDWCLSRDLLPKQVARFCATGDMSAEGTLASRNMRIRESMAIRHPDYPHCLPPSLQPRTEPLAGRIIVSEKFLDCVADGTVRVVPGVLSNADLDTVTVSHEGEQDVTLHADAVITCTGYEPPQPRLARLITPAPPTCEKLFHTMWSPGVPNAALLGLGYGFVAVPVFAALQAEYLARVASGAAALPSPDEMTAWLNAHHGSTQLLTDNAYVAALTAVATGKELGAGGGLYGVTANVATALAPAHAASTPELSEEGAVLAGSAFKSEEPEDTYAKWAATYDVDSANMGFDSPHTSAAQTLAFWPRAKEAGGAPVTALDIGCGTGDLVERLLGSLTPAEAAGTTFLGFDLSAPMLSIAEKRGRYAQLRQQSCGVAWPYADASVDIAFCNGVLIYVQGGEAREMVVSELTRVLKPGGHAVLMIREDNIHEWRPAIDHAESSVRQLRLVHTTTPRNNFPNKPVGEEIYYRQYVFERVVDKEYRREQEERVGGM